MLVASIVSRPDLHRAFLISTRSGGAGAPGLTVTVVVRVTANHAAVRVTVVVTLTAEVVTGNAPLDAPPFTTVSDGTWTTVGLLLDSATTAPSVASVKVTVPVAGLPPVRLEGITDTDDSDGPPGVAALTERFAERETFWIQAVIWTMVGRAAELVVIVNVTVPWLGGATTEDGTAATEGSLLNSRTVVEVLSGIRVTVPCADAPSRTEDGEIDSDEMMPSAEALVGGTSSTAMATNVARTANRRTAAPEKDSYNNDAVWWLHPTLRTGFNVHTGFSVAGCSFGPDDGHRHPQLASKVDDICGSAVAACGLSIPYSEELFGSLEHVDAAVHVSGRSGPHVVKPVNCPSGSQQFLVVHVRLFRQAVPVLLSRDDHFQRATGVEDRTGEHLVCAVSEAAQSDEVSLLGIRCQLTPDALIHRAAHLRRKPPVSADRDTGHAVLSSR